MPSLTFLGAAGTVTGSKHLIDLGDLGRYGRPVLPDPAPVAEADVLLVEATYGDRLHEPDDGGALQFYAQHVKTSSIRT